MTDRTEDPAPTGGTHLELDPAAFLPPGVVLAPVDADEADEAAEAEPGIIDPVRPEDDPPEPEVPAWALDDEPAEADKPAEDTPIAAAAEVSDAGRTEADDDTEVAVLEVAVVEVAVAVVEEDVTPDTATAESTEVDIAGEDTYDTTTLDRLEVEFAEIAEALEAIDSGDFERSGLLLRLTAGSAS